ncbi:MAG: amidohydrolase family protein [Chloroflexi bacterium]|nr:amidohydrolase family protein [Chloroflexota bacterium]
MKVITGGVLIDGTGRDPLTGATVVIGDDGRIEQVGRIDSLPKGAEVVDVAGKTIMPGLIDCHVHFFVDLKPLHELVAAPVSLRVIQAVENARLTLDAGVTSVRETSGTPIGFKRAAAQGLIAAPRMKISVAPLSQTGGHGDMTLPNGSVHPLLPYGNPLEWPNTVFDGVDGARKAARLVLRAGADFIKMMTTGGVLSPSTEPHHTQLTREEIATIVYEAKAQGKVCAAHAQGTEGIRNAVECGVESIEHGIYMDEAVIDLMKRKGTFLVPTLQAPMASIRRGEDHPGSVLPQSMRKAREVVDIHRRNVGIAIQAGVKVAMGTDAGVGYHGTNAEELRLMVEAGMTPMQSIVASTKVASECAHMDAEVGTLTPGKFADLLVVDGNPLDDIGILEDKSRLLMILQGGRAHKNTMERA